MPVTATIDLSTVPAELARWLSGGRVDDFPYDAVLERVHQVGKHFVAAELLDALAHARYELPRTPGSAAGSVLLRRFLDTALDKRDGRYDYQTYLALNLLPLPGSDDPRRDVAQAERQRDRLVAQLVADVMRCELRAAAGRVALLPELRPDARTTTKRYRLGLQAVEPALRRIGLPAGSDRTDPAAAAERVCAAVEADTSPAERLALRLSMLPVYVVHDEWMFIRVLQSFETTFALLAVLLRAAVAALVDGQAEMTRDCLGRAEVALHEAAPLFALLATMQVEAFRVFRAYTEGASAIQSRSYKVVESLCRRPDGPRLDSIAYLSVPEARARVLAGEPALEDAFHGARAAGTLSSGELSGIAGGMERFAATLLQWRQTHHRLAVRMLGERTGTGYTEGTPYLAATRTIPVFRSIPTDGEEACR